MRESPVLPNVLMPSLKKFFLLELEENMHVLRFVALFAAYSILSIILFFFTSGGWGMLVWMFFGWIPYTIVLVILFIVAVAQYRAGRIWVSIQKKDFAFLIIVQILALLLNVGDCGDAPNWYFFLERIIFFGRNLCQIQMSNQMAAFYHVFIALLWIYTITVLVTFFTPAIRATKNKESRKRVLSLYPLITGLCLILIGTYIHAIYAQNRWQEERNNYEETDTYLWGLMEGSYSPETCAKVHKEQSRLTDNEGGPWVFQCWMGLAEIEEDLSYCDRIPGTDGYLSYAQNCKNQLLERGIGYPPLQPFDKCPGVEAYKDQDWYKSIAASPKSWNLADMKILDACVSNEYLIVLYETHSNSIEVLRYDFADGSFAGDIVQFGSPFRNYVADQFGTFEGDTVTLLKGNCKVGTFDIRKRWMIPSGASC